MSETNKIIPQRHQGEAVDQLNKSKSLIANHGLGSGKSLTSILAGEKTKGSKLVLAPAALIGNYRKELKKFNINDKDYHLVSYEKFRRNPNAIIDKYRPELLIADEFHRTKDPTSLTGDTIRDARFRVNKFLGLTGSPIQNHPSEIADLLYTATGKPILGRDSKEFNKHFIKEKKVGNGLINYIMRRTPGVIEVPKNLDKFRDITSKYVHTFSGDEEYRKYIPEVERELRRVPMNDEQQKYYNYTFGKAPLWVKNKIKNNLPASRKESKNLNAFLIGARQVSNSTEGLGGSTHTPKLDAIVHDLKSGVESDPHFKGVVYSNFLASGLNPISKKLKKLNIPYGMFTGDQKSEERNMIIRDYNSGKLKALLISPAGAEGLDLKGTRYMGIMDPSWNPSRTEQIIGRTARYKSHQSLPENERKVKVVQYLSEPKLGLFGRMRRHFNPNIHAIGVDEYIHNTADRKKALNEQFTNILNEKTNV